jgi:hypothetical protein
MFSYHSTDPSNSARCTAPNDPKFHSELDHFNLNVNENEDQLLMSHCTSKYSVRFLTEWTKTINFRVWAVEHNPEMRCLSEYTGYVHEATIYNENGTVYRGALYKGKKLTKPEPSKA